MGGKMTPKEIKSNTPGKNKDSRGKTPGSHARLYPDFGYS